MPSQPEWSFVVWGRPRCEPMMIRQSPSVNSWIFLNVRSKKRRIRVSSATLYNPFGVDRNGTLKSQRINIVLPLKSLGFNSPNWVIPIGLLEFELSILDSCFKTSWKFENRLFMPIFSSFMSYYFYWNYSFIQIIMFPFFWLRMVWLLLVMSIYRLEKIIIYAVLIRLLVIREFRLFPFLKEYTPKKIFRFLPKSKFSLNNIFIDFPIGKTNLKTQISSFLTTTDKLWFRPA